MTIAAISPARDDWRIHRNRFMLVTRSFLEAFFVPFQKLTPDYPISSARIVNRTTGFGYHVINGLLTDLQPSSQLGNRYNICF